MELSDLAPVDSPPPANATMLIVPRRQARAFLQSPASPQIVVTDCGFFPQAAAHSRARSAPIDALIVIACAAGRGWSATRSGHVQVGPGQVLLLPPGEAHAYGADADEPWTIWWMHVAGRSLPAFLDAHGVTERPMVWSPSGFFEIVSLLTQVVGALRREVTTASLTRAAGIAWHLLSLIAADRPVARGMRHVVDEVAELLRADLRLEASAARLAAAASVSTSHLSTQFRRRFGMSVKHFQLEARMARARELFELHDLTVAEVARQVGYDDPLYFSRLFVRVHGVSPSAYRAGARGGELWPAETQTKSDAAARQVAEGWTRHRTFVRPSKQSPTAMRYPHPQDEVR